MQTFTHCHSFHITKSVYCVLVCIWNVLRAGMYSLRQHQHQHQRKMHEQGIFVVSNRWTHSDRRQFIQRAFKLMSSVSEYRIIVVIIFRLPKWGWTFKTRWKCVQSTTVPRSALNGWATLKEKSCNINGVAIAGIAGDAAIVIAAWCDLLEWANQKLLFYFHCNDITT